jgi:mannitol/fructose-specific phosphotransferase system IIA component (Ntr-type)
MKLTDFVVADAIVPQLRSSERDQAIEELVDSLIAAGVAAKALREELIKHVLDRENKGSTGFGKGVAVPHVKHAKIKKMAATIGVSQSGVDFNALDKAPVYAIVLLLSPEDKPDEHLQAMESIFSNLQKDQFRRFLRQASTTEDVVDLLHEADAQQLPG